MPPNDSTHADPNTFEAGFDPGHANRLDQRRWRIDTPSQQGALLDARWLSSHPLPERPPTFRPTSATASLKTGQALQVNCQACGDTGSDPGWAFTNGQQSSSKITPITMGAMVHTSGCGSVDWDALPAARSELLAAERELAAARGQEFATKLILDVVWDAGAPTPFLVSHHSRAAVVCYVEDPDPQWDGSCVTVVDSSSDALEMLGVIEFDGVYEVRFGGLNDEARDGHPLWGRGLENCGAHEVVNSTWITEVERRNSVHSHHQGGWHQRLKHYILCFHDNVLECLATEILASRVSSSFGDAVRSVSGRLLG